MVLAIEKNLRASGRAILDVIFPRWCLGCLGVVDSGPLEHICEACLAQIVFSQPPHCHTCGWPFPGMVVGERQCPSCLELDPEFNEGRTGMLMNGAARAFVHELKYHRGWHLRQDLRVLIRQSESLRAFVAGAILVPVPLHPRRRRWRGFNQARWVSEAIAAEAVVIGIDELLNRIRDTPTQTRLDRHKRAKNMENAFALRPGAVLDSSRRYVLVDDVFTTGATLNACAKVLRQSGAENVDIVSLGHG